MLEVICKDKQVESDNKNKNKGMEDIISSLDQQANRLTKVYDMLNA